MERKKLIELKLGLAENLEKGFENILEIIENNNLGINEYIVLSRRYKHNLSEYRNGLIKYDDFRIEENKVVRGLTYLIDDILNIESNRNVESLGLGKSEINETISQRIKKEIDSFSEFSLELIKTDVVASTLEIDFEPEKWEEDQFGAEGNGFWVVAIFGKRVIWYNDIEEGFNISEYEVYKKIDGYYRNQDKLSWTINRLNNLAKFGEDIINQVGPPQPLKR